MNKKRIAVPSNHPGGLAGERSDHFGHCDLFTLIDIEQGEIKAVATLVNEGHGANGCLSPVSLLQQNGVDAIVVAGIGARPLQGFNDCGINVHFAAQQKYRKVEELVGDFIAELLPQMDPAQACQAHGKCHGHGHGQPG